MLLVKRPTATTVLYTVSTRSPNRTLSSQLLTGLSLLTRIIIAILVLTALLREYRQWSPSQETNALAWLENAILTSPSGHLATLLSHEMSRIWRLSLCAVVGWLVSRKGYTEESLLVIRGLGVQTSTSSPSYLWTSSTRFIPTSSIQDIFIHEAFKGFEVRFYLSIVVEGEENMVVVFPTILPRREILEDVWRGARACLYEPKT